MMADAAAGKFGLIVCWSLDRFTREGVSETFLYLARLKANRVHFYSLTEEYFRTTGPAGELLIAVAAWIAESERRRRVERVKAGLARARAAGKILGRRSTTMGEERRQMRAAADAGQSLRDIATLYGVSKATAGRLIQAERNKTE
jgi:DNA invertase Pin-like site-specific DNA recombinase